LAIFAAILPALVLAVQLSRAFRWKFKNPGRKFNFGGALAQPSEGWNARLALGDEGIDSILGQLSHQSTKSSFSFVLGSRRKSDRRTYVGWTTDLKKRLQQHNAGRGAKSTRGREWILLYSECCKTRSEAMSREWHIKHDMKFRATLRATIW
jgi:putative endonuclease